MVLPPQHLAINSGVLKCQRNYCDIFVSVDAALFFPLPPRHFPPLSPSACLPYLFATPPPIPMHPRRPSRRVPVCPGPEGCVVIAASSPTPSSLAASSDSPSPSLLPPSPLSLPSLFNPVPLPHHDFHVCHLRCTPYPYSSSAELTSTIFFPPRSLILLFFSLIFSPPSIPPRLPCLGNIC